VGPVADPERSGSRRGWLEDPFATLGVSPDADPDAVRDAYRAALRAHPPERDPEGFKRLRAAYEVLRDPEQRARAAALAVLWVGAWSPPEAAELGAVEPEPLPSALVAEALRFLVLQGTDLEHTAFPEDQRPPPAPPWA
jgi:hypothetical protein